jgi:hydrogenase maturation protein HypF
MAVLVDGIVQGVGFRPFVYGLASQFRLGGFVKNRAGSVEIEVEGPQSALDLFLKVLSTNPPPLAKIDRISQQPQEPCGERRFRIQPSEASDQSRNRPIFISPDVATCDDCLLDLYDPKNHRHLYPFVNCTNCGPRLTIVKSAPYDRQRTTMASFEMCPECRAEYENPADRRFHAQPTCCPKCGPRLEILDGDGRPIPAPDPIQYIVDALQSAEIVAIKGLGGYHLACDARNESVVQELRRRKHRDEKPFAIMVRDIAAAQSLCEISPAEAQLLKSPQRPIVLLRKRSSDSNPIAASIAPKNPWLGVMLPYTPLHHLLLRAMAGNPLVMTSGNRSDEPIAYEDPDAVPRLRNIADLFLVHNRPIHVRCDDSVTRIVDGIELPVRRSRGYAPQPIRLPMPCPGPTLAVGGQLKATFALAHDDHAFMSHHMGDLDHFEASRAFERDIALYENLFEIRPRQIVHDLHPDYISTRYARRRAAEQGLDLLPIQHHHAHMAACMAENALDEPVIGVTFDGTGFGTDGTVWGGEFLVGDYRAFTRAAHLRPLGMPGADKAIHEPWRMAVSCLADADCDDSRLMTRLDARSLRTIRRMLANRFNSPITSSAGRLFDAVASLAGIRDRVSYEGQAAIEMEQLATGIPADGSYPFDIVDGPSFVVDTRPLTREVIADLNKGTKPATIARRFHSTIVDLIAAVCRRISRQTGIKSVVLSGGVFLNALLTTESSGRLKADDFRVFRHKQVPPNDGGLSLGQLAIAAAKSPTVHVQAARNFNSEPICASPSQAK